MPTHQQVSVNFSPVAAVKVGQRVVPSDDCRLLLMNQNTKQLVPHGDDSTPSALYWQLESHCIDGGIVNIADLDSAKLSNAHKARLECLPQPLK